MAPGCDEADFGRVEPAAEISRFECIRRLAIEMAHNPDVVPGDLMHAIGPTTAVWLAAMNDAMLLKVGCASDHALAQHITGKQSIRGVLVYDPIAITDYRRVLIAPASVADRQIGRGMEPVAYDPALSTTKRTSRR